MKVSISRRPLGLDDYISVNTCILPSYQHLDIPRHLSLSLLLHLFFTSLPFFRPGVWKYIRVKTKAFAWTKGAATNMHQLSMLTLGDHLPPG